MPVEGTRGPKRISVEIKIGRNMCCDVVLDSRKGQIILNKYFHFAGREIRVEFKGIWGVLGKQSVFFVVVVSYLFLKVSSFS